MSPRRYCPTGLPSHVEVSAKIEASAMRRDAQDGDREEFAHAHLCKECQQWHVYVPSAKNARNMRRNRRKKREKRPD